MENVVRRRIESHRLSRSRICGERRRCYWLEQTRDVCVTGNENVRLLRTAATRRIRRNLRTRLAWRGLSPPETGLWWCRARTPSASLSEWGEPLQIMTAADRGWHSGPWKPSFQFDERSAGRTLVFFDGSYRTTDPGPFPFVFTLGCLEIDLASDSIATARKNF